MLCVDLPEAYSHRRPTGGPACYTVAATAPKTACLLMTTLLCTSVAQLAHLVPAEGCLLVHATYHLLLTSATHLASQLKVVDGLLTTYYLLLTIYYLLASHTSSQLKLVSLYTLLTT